VFSCAKTSVSDNRIIQLPNPKSYNICREQADLFAQELGLKPAYAQKTAKPSKMRVRDMGGAKKFKNGRGFKGLS
jgi:hypothetical protein